MNALPAAAPRLRRPLLALALLLLTSLLATGLLLRQAFAARPPQVLATTQAGVARFNFRVTGIPVPGVVPGLVARVQLDPAALAPAHGLLTLDLRGLSTGLALRDDHARNYLGAATHPTATFQLLGLRGPARIEPGQRRAAVAAGVLTLNGVARRLEVPVELNYTDPAVLAVRAHFDVVFRDYRIDIPGADAATDVTADLALPVAPAL